MDISGLTVAAIAALVLSGEVTKAAAQKALAARQNAKLDRELAKAAA
jgi:hypothetical protein